MLGGSGAAWQPMFSIAVSFHRYEAGVSHLSLAQSQRLQAAHGLAGRRHLAKRNKPMPVLIPKDLAHTAKALELRQQTFQMRRALVRQVAHIADAAARPVPRLRSPGISTLSSVTYARHHFSPNHPCGQRRDMRKDGRADEKSFIFIFNF